MKGPEDRIHLGQILAATKRLEGALGGQPGASAAEGTKAARDGEGGAQRCIGGEIPLPSRAPSLCPATFSLTPSASLRSICNPQQLPPTALAASCNRLSNRLWGRL